MASSNKKLEKQLKDAGKWLHSPPYSCEDLLNFLDKVEVNLWRIEQGPIKSTQYALKPLMKALTSEELMRHSDKEVRISVATCITGILRITAPDPPYSDEIMKKIFKLTVTAFEDLSHIFSISFTKVVSILETFTNIRLFTVMLDLECDALITEMFQLFLNIIRYDHPHAVSSSMETIMSSILDENEENSVELLSILLNSVRNENKNGSPLSFKLGEKVLTKCADKLNPDLLQAVVSLGIDLKNHSEVVTSICRNTYNTLKRDYISHSGEDQAFETIYDKLVGCKINVWWPKSKRFNEGVIHHFDPVKKMLKVFYHEGGEEILNLSKEKWKLIKNVQSIDPQTPDASPELRHVQHSLAKTKSCYKANSRHSQNEKEEKKPLSVFASPPTISPASNSCSEMVEVGRYRVKASTAPILRIIFAKYGDIAAHCLYSSTSVRASLLEVICNVVKRLLNNDMGHIVSHLEIIENEVSDAEAAKIEVFWLRQHLEKIYQVKEVGERSSLLKGSKANSILIIKAANKELKERQLELVAALGRFKEAEKYVKAMEIVSRKIDADILESEAEEFFWRRRLNELL